MSILSDTEKKQNAITRERTVKVKRKHEIILSPSYKALDFGVNKLKLSFLNFFRRGRLQEIKTLEAEISELTDQLFKLSVPGYRSPAELEKFLNQD